MIKIKTSDLKTFLKRSKAIKQNGILPILSYFKMDCMGEVITCTDTNMHTFLLHEMPGESEKNGSYLIDRKTLQSVIDTSSSEFITFTQKGKKIFISDDFGGNKSNNGFQTDDPTLFPKMPDRGAKEEVRVSPELMKTIQIAKHYCLTDKTAASISPLECVHLKSTPDYTEVFSSNKFLLYVNRIPNDNIDLMITPECCDALNGFTEVLHYSSGNYNFFDCGTTTYGFIKAEYKCPDYSPLITGINREKHFIIERKIVLDYCNRIKSRNPSGSIAECEIREAGRNKVLFYYNDADHDNDSDVIFDVEKNTELNDFKFEVDLMIQKLGALPYEKVMFVPDKQRYFVLSQDDKEYIGLIMGRL